MPKRMFIYEIPYSVRKSLCCVLDATDKWGELGGDHMGFDYTYLQYIRRKDSPTDELLTSWGNQNHTVDELFVLLSKMQHYRAMSLIKEFVQEQYHHLLKEGEELMSRLPINKNVLGQGSVNRSNQRQNITDELRAVPGPSNVVMRPVVPLDTFEDNKDLGLDQSNLNLGKEKPESDAKRKTTNETKIQNIPHKREGQNARENAQNFNPSVQARIVHDPNRNLQLECPVPQQQPGQGRKLSNALIPSSPEGFTPQIAYEELEVATNSWDKACILGRGGFGTVYKGTWKNTLVAIKKLESQRDQQAQTNDVSDVQITQSLRELKYLNSHRHDNILSLYGYSISDYASCLVYQYMANGSLEDRLQCRQNTRPLNWAQRLYIMTGSARGIQFLHSLGQKPLVHGDIKSANILLDSNFEPRLGDFGLAREGPMQQYTHVKVSRVHGTRPYLPDEFLRGKQFSVRVDTYSFGVVLFEVATGLRAYDDSRKEKFLKDHIMSYSSEELCSLVDPKAGPHYCASGVGLLQIGRNCVTRPKDRPNMKSVLNDIDTLYNNYKGAERATSLARQRSLTPTNPLEMQVIHDELRNQSPHLMMQGSPQPGSVPFCFRNPQQLLVINAPTPQQLQPIPQAFQVPQQQQFVFPQRLSPEAQRFAKGTGAVQVLPGNQTGMPQAIIVHHPPLSLAGQRSPTPPKSIHSPPPQIDNVYNPTPLDSSHIPLLTLLGGKPSPDKLEDQTKVPQLSHSIKEPSIQDNPESKIQSHSLSQQEPSSDTSNRAANINQPSSHSDFSVSLPGENQSTKPSSSSPLDGSILPLVTLLGVTSDPHKSEQGSSIDHSVQSSFMLQSELSLTDDVNNRSGESTNNEQGSSANRHPDILVSPTAETQSLYMPMISELLNASSIDS